MSNLKEQFNKLKGTSYLERHQIYADQELVSDIESNILYYFLLKGVDSVIPASNESLSVGNTLYILKTIYRNYNAGVTKDINILLEDELIKMLNSNFLQFYAAMDIIKEQLELERGGTAPFKIDNPNVFLTLKNAIIKNYEDIKNKKNFYSGQLYENGLVGYVDDLKKIIENQKGISLEYHNKKGDNTDSIDENHFEKDNVSKIKLSKSGFTPINSQNSSKNGTDNKAKSNFLLWAIIVAVLASVVILVCVGVNNTLKKDKAKQEQYENSHKAYEEYQKMQEEQNETVREIYEESKKNMPTQEEMEETRKALEELEKEN